MCLLFCGKTDFQAGFTCDVGAFCGWIWPTPAGSMEIITSTNRIPIPKCIEIQRKIEYSCANTDEVQVLISKVNTEKS